MCSSCHIILFNYNASHTCTNKKNPPQDYITYIDQRGFVCSRFGRKRAVQIPVILMFIFSATTGLCPNFYLYLVSQFMVGIGYGGYRLNGIILGTVYAIILYLNFFVKPCIYLLISNANSQALVFVPI